MCANPACPHARISPVFIIKFKAMQEKAKAVANNRKKKLLKPTFYSIIFIFTQQHVKIHNMSVKYAPKPVGITNPVSG